MASDTATAKPDPARPRRRWLPGSRLGRLIVVLNLFSLAVLIAGALILNEMRRNLVQARIDSLTVQGQLIANTIAEAATAGSPRPMLETDRASEIIRLLFIPKNQRARLFDEHGQLLADSYLIADQVEEHALPPARPRGGPSWRWPWEGGQERPSQVDAARAALAEEVGAALGGDPQSRMRRGANGQWVISVSLPVQPVHAVVGVLTLEARDVEDTIAAQRRALMPFILVAVTVSLFSSLLLTWFVAQPIIRLANAADRVRQWRARAIELPDLAGRQDEIGDLTRSLQDMTTAQSERMDAIERFAADVAHEIRNPLTSIRSAVETLELVKDDASRKRLVGILTHDVERLDRLIGDISNASRLDAELSRDTARPLDLNRMLMEIASLYQASGGPGEVAVRYVGPGGELGVLGREGPLTQVVRNLIDNARSFSPKHAEVLVELSRRDGLAVISVSDHGPGIPAENLETVFERFYTARPKGAAFGGHSGLGLAISRQIVKAHGGDIRAENIPGHTGSPTGARFLVTLREAPL